MKKTPAPRPAFAKRLSEIGSLEKCAFYLHERGVVVSSSYLSMLARGIRDPSLCLARKLAKVLRMSISDVVGK
jgi:transcriptional regulator with XRE-family HTH domain